MFNSSQHSQTRFDFWPHGTCTMYRSSLLQSPENDCGRTSDLFCGRRFHIQTHVGIWLFIRHLPLHLNRRAAAVLSGMSVFYLFILRCSEVCEIHGFHCTAYYSLLSSSTIAKLPRSLASSSQNSPKFSLRSLHKLTRKYASWLHETSPLRGSESINQPEASLNTNSTNEILI
jgi:hypothetical protein